MTLEELKAGIKEHLHVEDDAMLEVMLASIIANRLKIGDPVWMMLIGASSGGKSQILRPLAMTDAKFLFRVDDMTDNTLLSGGIAKGGKDVSLLSRIGPHGMICISDLTVLFSKNSDAKSAILSQFRMLYDGEMTKMVGNKDKPLTWKGYLGIIAGGTPSIYSHFEEVSDMGERFLVYRMKPYNERHAAKIALSRKRSGRELDEIISEMCAEYIKGIVSAEHEIPTISSFQMDEIIEIASLAECIRATMKIDRYTKKIEDLPVPAMPMRTALQLSSIGRALMIMRGTTEITESDMDTLAWVGLSLANEKKREALRIVSEYSKPVQTQAVADSMGLDTSVVNAVLQNLAATGITVRSHGEGSVHEWELEGSYVERIRKIFGTTGERVAEKSSMTHDERGEGNDDF